MGIDVGGTRIGVAASDAGGLVATPVETVRRGEGDLQRLAQLIAEREAVEVIVGLPRSLRGQEELAAGEVRSFAAALARYVAPCPVRLVDERMTTAVATRHMQARGISSRRSRKTIDQAAAMVILQETLDIEREHGAPPGEVVTAA
nr:Holliday junction resolvase RuvX [Phytoactinopolyspora halophila]